MMLGVLGMLQLPSVALAGQLSPQMSENCEVTTSAYINNPTRRQGMVSYMSTDGEDSGSCPFNFVVQTPCLKVPPHRLGEYTFKNEGQETVELNCY